MRINAVIAEQTITPKGLADILEKLETGDVIRAKVLEITSGELMLKLFDGTVFRAATASEIDTVPGDSLELMVKGKNGGTLVLETVKKDTSAADNSQNEAVKLLNALDMKPDAKNLQLAGEIKSVDIKAAREIFDKASRLLDSFKSLTPEKAVFLSAKVISSEPRTINNAIRMIEGDLKLGSQLEDLYSVISKLTEEAGAKNITAGSQEMSKKQTTTAGSIIPSNAGSSGGSANKLQADNSETSETSETIENKDLNTKNISKNAVLNTEVNIDTDLPATDSIKTRQMTPDIDFNKASDNKQSNSAIIKEIPEIKPTEADVFKLLEPDEDVLLYKQKNSEENGTEIKEIAGRLKESFKKLFANTDSEKLSSELDVKKIYKDILDKLDGIKHISQTLSQPDRADITARANNIEDGIKLMNQISTNNIFVQIPLNLSGFNTTVDLYIVKKDKNKKRIDPQNAVMLISLDTQNLGRVETIIDVKGKNVGINLRAEDQKVIDFIKDNYRHLYSSLMGKGYRLVDVKYRLLEEKTNPVNVERTVKKELTDGRISVDLKI